MPNYDPQPPVFRVATLTLGPLDTNCYLLADAESGEAAAIDPADDAPAILRLARREGWSIRHILLTHGHFDHIGGLAELKRLTDARVAIHPKDAAMLESAHLCGAALFGMPFSPCPADRHIRGGEFAELGRARIQALETPGHTPGGLSYYIGSAAQGIVCSGDALFYSSVGRTDLPGGDGAALQRSIRETLFALPAATRVLPGHGPETSIGREMRENPYVRAR